MSRHPERPRAPRIRPADWSSRRRKALQFLGGAPGMEALETRQLMTIFTVTDAGDSGPGTLRQAILDANADGNVNEIDFNLPVVGSAVAPIQPLSALPTISDTVTIDGTTQPGYSSAGYPLVVLDGVGAGSGVSGLTVGIAGSASTIRGLEIIRFTGQGIDLISGTTDVKIVGNDIGIDNAGTSGLGNGGAGVRILSQYNHVGGTTAADRNVISQNSVGVLALGAENLIAGNYIGTTPDGSSARGNTNGGILIQSFGSDNTIGGTAPGAGNLISGNSYYGIDVSGVSATHTVIQGNLIGTDAAGTGAVGNVGRGVGFTNGSTGNTLGGNVTAARNVIAATADLSTTTGFEGHGVVIDTDSNVVQGNFLGTDSTGTAPLGNAGVGLYISSGDFNIIGTDGDGVNDAAEGNVIGGNDQDGVVILGSQSAYPAVGNVLAGNRIGTDLGGTIDLGNGVVNNVRGSSPGPGVLLWAYAQGTRIGTNADGVSDALERNVISANRGAGIIVEGATGSLIAGNDIGTTGAGDAALGNASDAILVENGGSSTTIGGTASASRNVISGNQSHGVVIYGTTSDSNLVAGNYIGLNAAGTAAVANAGDGVVIAGGATRSTVGGTAAGAGNVISGNGNGIYTGPLGTALIQGNEIGTDALGTTPIPNGYGVYLQGPGSTVGGFTASARNVISGNDDAGIVLSGASNNLVVGNYLGVDSTGSSRLGNTLSGIAVNSAPGNTIGGTVAGATNVIAANGQDGVSFLGTGATGNLVLGNLIGIDAAGDAGLGNTLHGVEIAHQSGNTIGGATAAGRNVIASNAGEGVLIYGVESTGNVVQGNYIGTDPTGTLIRANLDGVVIYSGASANTVGGTTAAARNLISGNTNAGADFLNADSNVLMGNFLGTNAGGTGPLANAIGVLVSGGSSNTIGGVAPGQANAIAFNAQSGVVVEGATAAGNVIRGNTIYGNTGLGIDLGALDGVTVNHGYLGAGPNDLQNYPTLQWARPGSSTRVVGSLDAAALTAYVIDVYANPISTTGHGQGQRYLGSITVTTDATGYADFDAMLAAPTALGEVLSATATSPSGSTSEFSADQATGSALIVTQPFSGGAGSLRQAIQDANSDLGTDAIQFALNLPASGASPIVETAVPTAGSVPVGMALGSDGNLWFGERTGNKIAKMTPSGTITEYPIPTATSNPILLTTGPDGNVWFTENTGNKIGRITPDGVITEFPIASANSGPWGITNGPDGNLWFAERNGNIGRITPQGVITEFFASSSLGAFGGIVTGPDGNLWFGTIGGYVGRMTTSGVFTAFATPSLGQVYDLAVGRDGNLWFVDRSPNKYGKITTAGVITEYDLPTADSQTVFIHNDRDGNLWYGTFGSANTIGRINPDDASITEYTVSAAGSLPTVVLPGPDGTLWFSEYSGNKIGRMALTAITPVSALPAVAETAIIDGTTQPGYAGTPRVELTGAMAGAGADGLTLAASGSVAKGLIVNRFSGSGLVLSGGGALVASTYVGTDASGVAARGNGTGIRVSSAANTIGGDSAAARNLISGNSGDGIKFQNSSSQNLLAGNVIGLDAAGASLGNAGDGVTINSGGNTVGGTASGAGNVISGNLGHGVSLTGSSATANVILGNLIGTDPLGTFARGNGGHGVVLTGGASGNTIGALTASGRNVISANSLAGIYFGGTGTSANVLVGNYVGTDATGTQALGNSIHGVRVSNGASNNTIGATDPAGRNVISGNHAEGVNLDQGSSGSVILNNWIGLDSTGASALPNSQGIRIMLGATGNVVGLPGSGNRISGNTHQGVVVQDVGTVGNAIRGNAISGNGGLAIDLGDDGVTANDPGDVDTGPNNLQNGPVLGNLSIVGGVTRIGGTIDSLAGGDYRIDFYASPSADASGYGPGETYLGTIDVTTYGGGDGSFLFDYPGLLSGPVAITATATDAAGNTSEFSHFLANDQRPIALIDGGDRTVAAGSTATFVSDSTDPDGNPLTLTWTFGDGSPSATGASVSHVFATAGTYHVVLTADDGLGGISSDNVVVTTTSGAPVVAPLTLGPIDENALASLNVSFTEPDPSRSTVADIDWGDLSTPTHVVLAAGADTFSASHAYLDGTPSDYRVTVTVTDSVGQTGTAVGTQHVNNVAPTITGLNLDQSQITEGQAAHLTGTLADPGTLDGHTVLIAWGDGLAPATTTVLLLPGQTTFDATRVYPDNPASGAPPAYTIRVDVTDKDGATATQSLPITVANVAPTVSFTTTPASTSSGLTLKALVSDPGVFDTFTYAWTANPGGLTGSGSTFTFPATASGAYTVTLTVTDNAGGSTSFSSLVITGSDANDQITLAPAGAGLATITANGTSNTVDISTVQAVLVVGLAGSDVIDAHLMTTPVILDGGSGDDTVSGGSGNDTLVGGSGNNVVSSGDGNNLFLANPYGVDTLIGGSGNDTYQILGNPAGGDPTLDDSGGTDTLDFSLDPTGVTVDLNTTGTAQQFDTQGTGNDLTLNGQFENIIGTSSGDTLYANSTTGSKLVGGGGNDLLYGGSGNDQLYAGIGDSTLSAGGGDDTLYGGYGNATMSSGTGNATMYGSYGNSSMSSGTGNATMYGSYGNATMSSGTGNATMYGSYGNTTMSSGTGNATMYGSYGNTSMSSGTGNATMYGSAGNTTMSSSGGNATMYGSYGNTSMSTGSGNATMYGSAGNTSMSSGSSNATMYGGYGNTTMSSGSGNATMYGSAGNTSMSTGGGNATMYGSAGNTTMSSGSANATMYGSYGNTSMSSGSGNATMYGSYGNTSMSSSGGNATMYGSYGNTSMSSGSANATMYGSYGNTSMSSGTGNATMYGGYGNTSMSSGTGNATMYGSYGNTTMSSGGGNATMYGGYGNTSMSSGTGNATMYGSYGNTSMSSGTGNATMYGGYGNTSMSTGGGNATMYGGYGNTSMSSGTGNATMYGSYGNTSMSSGTGNATMYGSYGNTSMSSSSGNATMYGGTGNTTMFGGPRNDWMKGGSGRTTMYGGGGDDLVQGGLGDDTLIEQGDADMTVTGSQIVAAGYGTVSFSGVRRIALIAGDGGVQLDASGATVPVYLQGGAGNDTLLGGIADDTLEGGAGDDLLIGNAGSDTYAFGGGDLGSDRVVEAASADSDTLDFASFSAPVVLDLGTTAPQVLGGGLLTLTLSDATAIENVDGSAFNDVITGNARDNLLIGAGGADSLYGGAGDDTLVAGRIQTVFLDFDTFTYAGAHVYTPSERDAIQARMAGDYADFTFRFTQTRPTSGAFVTVFFNRPLGDYSGGSSSGIDWRDLSPGGVATVDVNQFVQGGTPPPATAPGAVTSTTAFLANSDLPQNTSADIVALSATIAAHELGHLSGLEHEDAFGAVGDGAYARIQYDPNRQYLPPYPGPYSADETSDHLMGSPASIRTDLFQAAGSPFFGEREAVKLAFADHGSVVDEQTAPHQDIASAQLLDVAPLAVPNTLLSGLYAGDPLDVAAVDVVGSIKLDPNGNSEDDYYAFDAKAGDIVNLQVLSASLARIAHPIDSILRMFDASGNLLKYYSSKDGSNDVPAVNDDTFESQDAALLDLPIPADGRYYIQVDTFTGRGSDGVLIPDNHTGDYELFLWTFHAPALAAAATAAPPAYRAELLDGGDGTNTLIGGSGPVVFADSATSTPVVNGPGYTIDAPPQSVSIGADQAVGIGQDVAFKPSFVDPDDDTGFAYLWRVSADNGQQIPGGADSNFHFTPSAAGTYFVTFTVTDPKGATGQATAIVTVSGAQPSVSIAGAPSVDEGAAYQLDLSALNFGRSEVTSWSIHWGDGQVQAIDGNPTSVVHIYDDGPSGAVITATATSPAGNFDAAPISVSVTDVAPTAALSAAPAVNIEGMTIALTASASDPSPIDTAAGFLYAWTVTRDGAPVASGGNAGAPAATASVSFTPLIAGSYVVSVTATDRDGLAGAPLVRRIDVQKHSTATSLSSSAGGPATFGTPVTLAATVTSPEGNTPGGSVQFYDGVTPLGAPVALDATGTARYTLPAGTSVGTHSIGAEYLGDPDDAISSAALDQAIVRATPTVVVSASGMTYSGESDAASATVAGYDGKGASSLEGVGIMLTYFAGSTPTGTPLPGAPTSAGTYTVLASFAGSTSYEPAASLPVKFTIGQAPLKITAVDQRMEYGATIPALTVAYAGFVHGETAASLSAAPTVATSATSRSHVGTYVITASGAVAQNYAITYVDGMLTVNPRAFSYQIGNDSQLFGYPADLARDLGTTISTGVNGDMLAIAYSSPGDTASAAVGSYPITGTLSDGTGCLSDYRPTLASGTLTVALLNGSAYVLGTGGNVVSASGNAVINMPGGLYVDSGSASAVQVSGKAQVQVGGTLDVAGGVVVSGSGVATWTGTVPTTADPFASLPTPGLLGLTSYAAVRISTSAPQTLQPGIYPSIQLSGMANVTMAPGIYILRGGGLSVSGGARLSGSGVMIFNAGSAYDGTTDGGSFGGITLGGDAACLSPSTSGPYAGVTIFQSRSNPRGMVLGGSASGSVGAVYAPAATVNLSGNAQFTLGSLIAQRLVGSGSSGAFQLAEGTGASYVASIANWIINPVLTVAFQDNTGAGPDPAMVADLGDAMAYLNAALAAYGVGLSWADAGSPADVIVSFASTSPQGGASDGVLGFTTETNAVYLVAGWDYYTGSDPTLIGPDQFDFTTLAIHELAHTIGLGESQDPNSVLYEYLAAGTVRRTLTDGNLSAINSLADRFMKVAAPASAASAPIVNAVVTTPAPSLPATPIGPPSAVVPPAPISSRSPLAATFRGRNAGRVLPAMRPERPAHHASAPIAGTVRAGHEEGEHAISLYDLALEQVVTRAPARRSRRGKER